MSDTYPVGARIYDNVTTTVTGDAIQCRGRWKFFVVEMTSGTVTVQGSAGYDDWHTLYTTGLAGSYQDVDPWPYIRVNLATGVGITVYMAMGE